ncbi:unnamed protein product, partial [Rotaria magnacalcarata]
LRDDTLSLNDLVRYAQASLNLNISRQTVSRILREFDLVSYVAPRKPQITHEQRRCRIFWCYTHLSWTETDWSNVIFSDEANFEIRHERFQPRVHRGGGLGIWSYITYNDLGPISNMAQLEEALKTVWAEISKDVTRKLFQSMPTRLRQVINNKGYACCY